MKASRSTGFSMVDMLITIAIIGVLSALLFPLIGHISQRAKGAKCIQNLRQLHIALYTYATEHEGYFPKGKDGAFDNSDNWVGANWISSLGNGGYIPPYNKESINTLTPNQFLIYCPGSGVRFDNGKSQPHLGHYGINTAIVGRLTEDSKPRPSTPLLKIQFPSQKLLLFDSGYNELTQTHLHSPSAPGNYLPGLSTNRKVNWPSGTLRELTSKKDALEGRHGKRVNLLMVDGHVENWSPEDFLENPTVWTP